MCHEGHLPSVQIKLGLTGRHLALHTNEFTLMSWLLPLLINFNTIFSSFLCRLSPRGTAPSITCQHPSHIPLWSWSSPRPAIMSLLSQPSSWSFRLMVPLQRAKIRRSEEVLVDSARQIYFFLAPQPYFFLFCV